MTTELTISVGFNIFCLIFFIYINIKIILKPMFKLLEPKKQTYNPYMDMRDMTPLFYLIHHQTNSLWYFLESYKYYELFIQYKLRWLSLSNNLSKPLMMNYKDSYKIYLHCD